MKKSTFILTTFVFLFCAHNIFGGGFQINTQSQKAVSMGGSLTGVALDGSVAFFNPGGMVFLKKSSAVIGATGIVPKSAYLSPLSGTQTDMKSQTFLPFHVYGAFKLNEKLAVGLSINTPYGLGTKWNKDWEGRYISQEAKLTSIYFQPTVAYKLSEKFGIGAGFVYARGTASIKKAIPVESSTTTYGTAKFDGSGDNIGFNAGIQVKFSDELSAGISYRSKIKIEVKDGDATFTDIPASLNGQFPGSTTFNTIVNLPSVLSVAAGYYVTKELLVHLETNLTGWSSFDSLNFTFPDEYASLNASGKNGRNYKDAIAVRAGVQYSATKKLDLRVGAAFDQSPVKDGYVSPDLPDANKYSFGLGLTFKITEALHIDLSYLFETLSERQDVNKETMFGGSYKTLIHAAGLGINFDF
jgi:long-chain fatty acid transport protein